MTGNRYLIGNFRIKHTATISLSLLQFKTGLWAKRGKDLTSQNHRIVGVGRDLCGSSSPSSLPKQGCLQQAAQNLVQAGLEYLQRRRIHSLSGHPVPVLRHPRGEEVLPHVQTELPMLPFVPVAPCPVAGHQWKESSPILLTSTLKIFLGIYKVPSQPSPGWTSPAPSVFPRRRDALVPSSSVQPSSGLSPVVPHLSWTGEPRTGHITPDEASLGQSRGGGEPPRPAGHTPLDASQDTIGLFWQPGHTASSWSTCRPPALPGPSLQSCSPAGQPQAFTGVLGCSSPGAGPCPCPCWTSSRSSAPNSPACPGLTEWQHSLLMYLPLLPVWCHQQTCWGYILTLHPGRWWRSGTRLGQVLTPGGHH